ncbi:MAG TPA: hypothetical protein VM364_11300 [Vicinamibacterales bacterium]|nr:hypothetical protein [Vicinamibacterales bacterium]
MRKPTILLTATVVLLGGGWITPAFAQKGGCKDIPLRWFIAQTVTLEDGTVVPSTIAGDGNWYSGGSNNVIHVCGTNPSYDATIVVPTSRKVSFSFGPPVPGSIIAESLPPGTYLDSPFLNVRNLLCVGCAPGLESFTTRMGIQLQIAKRDHRLRFMPFETDAPDRHTQPGAIPAENVPYLASPVRVFPQPYNCTSGGKVNPSWIVRGTVTSADPGIDPFEGVQVGTLTRVTSNAVIHRGQYSMPFEIRIEALSCFSY